MAPRNDYMTVRTKLWKVTTQFTINDDLCHSAHFVWAKDEAQAQELVAKHAHACSFIRFEHIDTFIPGDAEKFHRLPAPDAGPTVSEVIIHPKGRRILPHVSKTY